MTRRLTAVLLLIVSTGCSRKKTLTSDELKSQLTRAISFASEEEMPVNYPHAGRATSNFAEQHAAYLDAENSTLSRRTSQHRSPIGNPICASALSRLVVELDEEFVWPVFACVNDSSVGARTSEKPAATTGLLGPEARLAKCEPTPAGVGDRE